MIIYGLQSGYGQMKIVVNSRSIEDVLNDKNFPDTLKKKLLLIQEIRKFAIDSIGLKNTKNYTTVYDQRGKAILWIVTACPKYELKAYLWHYPIVGSLPYKGFFIKDRAEKEAEKFRSEGFDAKVSNVSGWSTLGFFKDPILSNMLYRSEGELAELIIHEMTHATLYRKGQGQFNENLATLVGVEGAKYFLIYKYGIKSKEYLEYIYDDVDEKKFARHILSGAKQLDSLYHTFNEYMPEKTKDSLKRIAIERVFDLLDTVSFYDKSFIANYKKRKSQYNNTFFIGYKTYHEEQSEFEKDFKEKFNSNFKAYINYLLNRYSSV